VDYKCSDPQEVQKILRFRTNVLALDPCAEFFVDGNPLKVLHSKCRGPSVQVATNDVSNFREHVSICKTIHQASIAPVRPTQLPCPGFNLEELCGKAFISLPSDERQHVTSTVDASGFVWLDSREKRSIISKACLKKSPSHRDPAQPCASCSKVVELSNIKETICRVILKPKYEFFNPFRNANPTTGASGEQLMWGSPRQLISVLADNHQ
jgi:hypothetical protein